MTNSNILLEMVAVARTAGEAILEIYQSCDFGVEMKADDSPLTRADTLAHNIIVNHLESKFSDIPCLSEESESNSFTERKQWKRCFIIDPLDGTKEFIAKNDDFTVNIALIDKGKPILGVVYAPVQDTLYYASQEGGAFKVKKGNKPKKITVRSVPMAKDKPKLTIVSSRRHGLENVKKLCKKLGNYEITSRGSSLKMCLIAEGQADFYPRLAPTAEWDTAAAQVIVEAAGGKIVDLEFYPLTYNQKKSILNPHFYVIGDPNFDWKAVLS